MNKRIALSLAVGMALIATGQSPASTKPCRGKDGRIVACPKPPRNVPPRCKDEKGRFMPCRGKDDAKPKDNVRQPLN